MPEFGFDRRAVTPAVGKALELGIVVLFIGLLVTVLLGGVVPDYRAATSAEVGERVLATAAQEIEDAVPPVGRDVTATREVDLPATIADEGYRLRTDGRWLVLAHPHEAVGGRLRLSLPNRVDRLAGEWDSGGRTVVRVVESGGDLVVRLENGNP